MLWSKEEQSENGSYVDLFPKKESDSNSSVEVKVTDGEKRDDDREEKEFVKRLKHYDKKFEEFAKERREEGKKLFGKKDYMKAMKEFNRCLMFAQSGSTEIGLAYANRSACFLYLNMFRECVADIELAMRSNYPEELMEKLDKRKSKCEEFGKANIKPLFSPIREPSLSFSEHEKFSGVGECLEIQRNEEHGLHVVTNSNLEIGQTILLEKPFSIVPTRFCTQNRERCFNCFSKLKNFISCQDCLVGFYCDVECMTKAHHKTECNMEIFSDDKEQIQLVVKTFLNINTAFPDVDALMKTVECILNGNRIPDDLPNAQRDFCILFQLECHRDRYSNEKQEELKNNSKIAYDSITSAPDVQEKYATNEQRNFLQHLILHLSYTVKHAIDLQEYVHESPNSPLASYSFEHYAKATYSFGSNIKHSCLPNVLWFSVNDLLMCKVIRPIKKGEQLFRSHFPGMESYMRDSKLQQTLIGRFHIDCKCNFCSKNMWSPLVDRENLRDDPLWNGGIDAIFLKLSAFKELSRDEIESYEENAIKFLKKYDHRHPLRDTISMQEFLQILWNLLASPL